ncbi:hypothetical protein NDK50_14960 [Paraburkholderia bryophila]|uniref:hypothetical protein n=1 Tax=Paraburkholderia bryophila TaxID=420952 RepID=UPI00234A8F02|nr:hypothetical protein [Paraburkholderia bryophila]WCM18733.1 hypothetical protein NDK50_14960 [Paraburkholderia bryophila]
MGRRRSASPRRRLTQYAVKNGRGRTVTNQPYSWNITYVLTTIRGQYFYLYLFLDVVSRKTVGWQVYAEESSALASEVLLDLCACEAIQPDQVFLHPDNGGPIKGATMLATLQALDVMLWLNRPGVSNDNPYSESLFKTLKHRPAYPLKPFDTLFAAGVWGSALVRWYNRVHRHGVTRSWRRRSVFPTWTRTFWNDARRSTRMPGNIMRSDGKAARATGSA